MKREKETREWRAEAEKVRVERDEQIKDMIIGTVMRKEREERGMIESKREEGGLRYRNAQLRADTHSE